MFDVDEMGAIAGKKALGNSNIPDLIINASGVPKQTIPDTSTFYQKALGFEGIPSFSIHCTCLSFVTAFNTASALISSNIYKKILIISSDRGTRGRNFNEPESASLLGDGAAAILLEPSTEDDKSELLFYNMKTWPSGAHLTEVRGGGTNKHPQDSNTKKEDNLFSMNGPEVFKFTLPKVHKMILDLLSRNDISQSDINLLIPHQASGKAVEAYISPGGFDKDRVINIVSKYGNCVAASVPMALTIAIKENRVKRGDLVLFVGTGAGLSAACALIKY